MIKYNHICYGTFFLLCSGANLANATSIQIYHTMAYENPAMLNAVDTALMTLGVTDLLVGVKYEGQVNGVNGTVASNTNTGFPYLRIAQRLNTKLVAAFDFTHPAFANIKFPDYSFVSPVANKTYIRDDDFSPKLSYQLTDSLALGVGFNANNIQNNIISLGTPTLYTKTSGWAYGYDLGVSWKVNQFNTISLSYYSLLNFTPLTGNSYLQSMSTTNMYLNINLPPTYTLNLTQNATPEWTFIEIFRYVQWSVERNLTLSNTVAGELFFPLNYQDVWSALLLARYQWTDALGVGVIAAHDTSPQTTAFRPIALPAASLNFIGGNMDYAISPQWSTKIQYTYAFTNPAINQSGVYRQIGHEPIGISIFDLGVTWKG